MKLRNDVKAKYQAGKKTLGIFCELGSLSASEVLAASGLDYFIVDCEHGPFGVMDAQQCVAGALLHNCTPLVRIPDHGRASVLKYLDIGAMGLIIPAIDSVGQVYDIVRHGKYAPLGNRGFGATRRDCWGQEADPTLSMPEMLALHNRETLLIPQCETVGCLDHIEEIAAIEGVDGIFIGPFDLSIALGIPGQLESDEFLAAITKVLNACKNNGKPSFIFAKTIESARRYLDMGFDSVTYGMDVSLLQESIQRVTNEVLK